MPLRPSSLIRTAAALLALGLTALPGQAQAPKLPPEFHARVFMAGFEQPLELRQAGLKRRVDVATGGVVQSFISDRTRGALVVMTAAGRRRVAFLFPLSTSEANAPVPIELGAFSNARMTRLGGSRVAGRPCTLNRYVGYLGRNGTACISADGLVLQLVPDGRRSPLYQVLSITYAKQDARVFTPPPDFQVSALPGTGGISVRSAAAVTR